MIKEKVIKIAASDNIAVALEAIRAGETLRIGEKEVAVLEDLEQGHKLAIRDIREGENVIRYGYPIGHATCFIKKGDFVHTHNIKTNLEGLLKYTYEPESDGQTEYVRLRASQVLEAGSQTGGAAHSDKDMDTFMGYVRENGEVGIRNEIWIINTVGCVNKTAENLAKEAMERFGDRCDGIFHFPHPFGCCQLGEDHRSTQKILADLVRHPNAAGILVLGLGCESNNIPEFKKVLGPYCEKRVRFLNTQEVEDEMEKGLEIIDELVAYTGTFQRRPVPMSKLVIGLKCGGSDGLSGITANPLAGAFTDRFTREGGTAILTEVPEMFGAETLLMKRCISKEVFDKTVTLINDFKNYYIRHNQVIYENPSPGNKKGGISTLEEKSLGCTQKGGTSSVVDVLKYAEKVSRQGLNLLEAPGNDGVAVTALTASGAHLILFTTGRGNPLGAPVPCIKISSNSELAARKKNWIDFNAGELVEGKGITEAAEDFYQFVKRVASGEIRTKNEINGYREISIFKDGVTV